MSRTEAGETRRTCSRRSAPFMRGMRMSATTTSNACFSTSTAASSGEETKVMSQLLLMPCNVRRKPSSTLCSSSTKRMRLRRRSSVAGIRDLLPVGSTPIESSLRRGTGAARSVWLSAVTTSNPRRSMIDVRPVEMQELLVAEPGEVGEAQQWAQDRRGRIARTARMSLFVCSRVVSSRPARGDTSVDRLSGGGSDWARLRSCPEG